MQSHASHTAVADRAIDDLNKAVDYWQGELTQLQADADWHESLFGAGEGVAVASPAGHRNEARAKRTTHKAKHRR